MTRLLPTVPLTLVWVIALLVRPQSARALENKYDVLARTIAPIAALFVEGAETKTATAEVTVVELTGAPKEFLGSTFVFAIQAPDRVSVSAALFGERLTVCRNRQRVWAAPGSQLNAILAHFEPLPAPDPDFTMGALRLPFTRSQMAFLPALFVAADSGVETVAGQPCRALDLKLAPEVARGSGTEEWSARLCITADYKPARILLQRSDRRMLLDFHKIQYGGKIPDSHWMPGPADLDPVGLGAARLSQILELLMRELGERHTRSEE